RPLTDFGGKTSIFSHPVYLFLREFSLQDFRGGSVLRKTAWRLLNERYQRIKLNQAYRIENFLLVADFEYALEEHDELAE
ncbi:hypothetical protein ACRW20_25160, partial [Escherichia coli]